LSPFLKVPDYWLINSLDYLLSAETVVREADAILLGYPLQRKLEAGKRLNDLTFYEKVNI